MFELMMQYYALLSILEGKVVERYRLREKNRALVSVSGNLATSLFIKNCDTQTSLTRDISATHGQALALQTKMHNLTLARLRTLEYASRDYVRVREMDEARSADLRAAYLDHPLV